MIDASRITVLMTTDTVGGVWTYSCMLAMALVSTGTHVHLVTMGPPPRSDQRAMLRDRRIHLIETDLALEWQDPDGTDIAKARRILARLESRIGPDIIHLNSFREAAFNWNAPAIVVAHSCANSWARACRDTAWLSDPAWQRYTRAVRTGLNRAKAWVSPSLSLHNVITDLYRPHAPGMVIWNGIPPASSSSPKRACLLAAGRLGDRAKNVSAVAELAQGLQWPLLMAGPNPGDVPPGPIWLGSLDHDALQSRMKRAALFVSLAHYEPFGLAVLEAASAACALVLSDIPSFRELWDGAAVFVDPGDRSERDRTVRRLCADHAWRTQFQRAAKERSRRYALAQMASAYRSLYAGLLRTRVVQSPFESALEMRA